MFKWAFYSLRKLDWRMYGILSEPPARRCVPPIGLVLNVLFVFFLDSRVTCLPGLGFMPV